MFRMISKNMIFSVMCIFTEIWIKKTIFSKKRRIYCIKKYYKNRPFPRNIDIYRFMGKNRLSLNDLKINVLFPEMCIVTKIWIKKTTFSKKRRRYGHKNVIKNALFLKILTFLDIQIIWKELKKSTFYLNFGIIGKKKKKPFDQYYLKQPYSGYMDKQRIF